MQRNKNDMTKKEYYDIKLEMMEIHDSYHISPELIKKMEMDLDNKIINHNPSENMFNYYY